MDFLSINSTISIAQDTKLHHFGLRSSFTPWTPALPNPDVRCWMRLWMVPRAWLSLPPSSLLSFPSLHLAPMINTLSKIRSQSIPSLHSAQQLFHDVSPITYGIIFSIRWELLCYQKEYYVGRVEAQRIRTKSSFPKLVTIYKDIPQTE